MFFVTQRETTVPTPAPAPVTKSFFIVFGLILLALTCMVVMAAQTGHFLLATDAGKQEGNSDEKNQTYVDDVSYFFCFFWLEEGCLYHW